MTNQICTGCGSALQNANPQAMGYTPKTVIEQENTLCQRCFKLRHYGEIIPSSLSPDDYLDLIASIASQDALVVMVVDLFDLEGSMMPQIRKLTNDKDMIVIANKRDLLPKSVSNAKLRHNVMKLLHREGLKPQDVLISSAVKKHGIDEILESLFSYAKKRDVYMLGATNVGKSTLINAFLSASGAKVQPLTVHASRGTTQGMIPISFEDQTLYDTPGLYNPNHMAFKLSASSYQLIQPKKEIKPQIFQLNANQTLFLAGLCRLDYLKGDKASFVVMVSDRVRIHRRKSEDSTLFYEKHQGALLTPPTLHDDAISLKPHRFNLKVAIKTDLVIPGLGFITIKGAKEVTLYTPDTIIPYQREALI